MPQSVHQSVLHDKILSSFKQQETTQQQINNEKDQHLQQSFRQQYQVIAKLGSGAYGHVWKIKDKKTNQIYALKKVFSAFQNDTDAQRTYRQIVYLMKLSKHQNIVKLKKVQKAENDQDLYLFFQFMDSDLFYSIKQDLLNELHKKYILYQLAKCLKYVHSAGIVHRDVKPSNILINSNCQIRLCDFGLSRTLYKYNNQQQILTQFIATRWYRAPQVLFGSQSYNTKSDMWSVGCVIYQLYARRPLLPGSDTVDQIQKLLQFKGFPNHQQKKSFKIPKFDQMINLFQDIKKKPLNDYFKYLPCQQVKELLIHLLQYNPQKRWTADDLLNCSFFQQFKDLQNQIQADRWIKTPIPDSEKKSVDCYREAIYNTYCEGDKNLRKQQQLFKKINLIKQKSINKNNISNKSSTVRQAQLSSQQNKCKPKSKNILKSNSYESLHYNKMIDNISRTQRETTRKNYSSHLNLKNNSKNECNQKGKSLINQKGTQNKEQPFFRFNFKNRSIKYKTPNSSKNQQINQQMAKVTNTSRYPGYVRNSFTKSKQPLQSRIPHLIQQKLAKQKQIFYIHNYQKSLTSKILSSHNSPSKQKKSPYLSQLQSQQQKYLHFNKSSTGYFSRQLSKNNSIHLLNQNEKENIQNNTKKLKRKGKINN